jgi:hypothetical protein
MTAKPRSGRHSRRKGSREELALVRFLQDHGFAAEKLSRTGYTGPDVSVPLLGVDRRVEVKVRSNGFRQPYDWLADADLLVVRADRAEPLVSMVDQEIVRERFYAGTPAEGTPEQKGKFRRKRFKRAIDWAEDQQLIAVKEIDGITYLRLTLPDPEQGKDG